MAAELLEALLRANIAASAAIVLVLLLRRPARRQFDALAAYALWLTVPLAALTSLLPRPAMATMLEPLTLAVSAMAVVPSDLPVPGLVAAILVAAWLGGMVVAAGLLSRRQAQFMAALGRLSTGADGVLRAEHPAVGPAVVGALRPRIVTPADFETRFDAEEQELILSHEGVHLARGDGLANALAAAAQCVCWFNPLVHVAVRSLRIDQELACDAAVLARHPQQRGTYARALLKAQLDAPALPVGCHWPAAGEHPLKERIAMLKSPRPAAARRIAGLAAAGAASLIAAGAAWAVQPGPQPGPRPGPLVTRPVWISKPTIEDLVRVMPPGDPQGQATMECQVQRDGRLTGCRVLRETPQNAGLGAAALQLAPHFQMAATSADGIRTNGGNVRIPFRFVTPAE